MDKILVLDFGSQYTQLIARRIRELKVYCEIHPFNLSLSEIQNLAPKGIILSGSPASLRFSSPPLPAKEIFNLNIPVLGICYGMQVIAQAFGGRIKFAPEKRSTREYGPSLLSITRKEGIFSSLSSPLRVWMSHGDTVSQLPRNFIPLGETKKIKYAAFAWEEKRIYGVQFHPEVYHTEEGKKIFANFLFKVCACKPEWTMKDFLARKVKEIREEVGSEKILCALSGGVDSTVLAYLCQKAVGKNLRCVFIDTGLLRRGEKEEVKRNLGGVLPIRFINAQKRFLTRLSGIEDPEEKRRVIGEEFIKIFEEVGKGIRYLAQGTLYPDVIESGSFFGGPSARIKTHHNVGGLPEKINFRLIEPFRELFKDEVRKLGIILGVKKEVLKRHPFPGPGLAVRILGEVTEEKLEMLRAIDQILITELKRSGFYDKVWQAFSLLLPVKSVGVMGDERTYENVSALRIVTSRDGMTADWARIPYPILSQIANRIINEVKGVNRVVYDISTKPPATIEWE
uniref:GMP synthase [glutamine-hydrolyzing] n=1 Tax=candidate division WOR-3 bacterium TaxID=2052148 RepID=A0A7C3UX26_UNCW3